MKIQLSDHFDYKRLLRFVAPSILMLLCTSIYSIVDGFFVSNFVGKTPFAALNLVMPVLMGVGTIGFMAGTGGSAVVSMTLGEGKKELANEYFSLIVYVTLAVSVVLGLIGYAFAPQIALALGANGDLEADCVLYSRILFLSTPAFVMQYLFQSFFIAAEKPTLSLKINVLAGLTNAVLDYVLIVVFPLGLAGAALATAAGQVVGGAIPIIYFAGKNSSLLRLGKMKWHGKVIWQTCMNGSSELVTNLSTSIVGVLYNFQLMEAAGENGVAAYGVVANLALVGIAVFTGLCTGIQPLVSRSSGLGDREQLRRLFRWGICTALGIAAVLCVSVFLGAEPLTAVFNSEHDPQLAAYAESGLRIYFTGFLFAGVNMVTAAFFSASDKTVQGFAISLLRGVIAVPPILFPLAWALGVDGVWLTFPMVELVTAVAALVWARKYIIEN